VPEAVIVATGRSPIGRAGKGSLIDVRPDDLVGHVVRKVLDKVPELPAQDIDDLICGCGYPALQQGMNIGRLAVFISGLPLTVPGTTVSRFCASSLQAIRMAFHAIKAGEGDTFVCAGVESYSRVGRGGMTDEDKNPRLLGAGAGAVPGSPLGLPSGMEGYIQMGVTAENVADRYNVSREDMDVFALGSQQKAARARDTGVFAREIIPVVTPAGVEVTTDDGIRADTTLEKLASLAPVFREDGRVTAGNACPLNDGAAAVVVLSAEKAARLGIKPLARIVASSVSGVDPTIMGVGPIEAVRKVLGGGRDDGRGHRPRRAQRSLRVAGAGGIAGGGVGHGSAQSPRRRDRAGPPVWHDRRAHHDRPGQRPPDPRQDLRLGDDVRRRRPGDGDDHRAAQLSRRFSF